MPRIAISYRRDDSQSATGRIAEKLVSHFGEDEVFMDIDNIPPGIDFLQHIRETIAQSDVVLAVIGKDWLSKGNKRRLNDPRDVVRIEIQTALERGILVIPVLVDNAKMPAPKSIPDALKRLLDRNGAVIDPGRDFYIHMDRLTRSIQRQLKDHTAEKGAVGPTERDGSNSEDTSAPPERADQLAFIQNDETSDARVEQLGINAVRTALEDGDHAPSSSQQDEQSDGLEERTVEKPDHQSSNPLETPDEAPPVRTGATDDEPGTTSDVVPGYRYPGLRAPRGDPAPRFLTESPQPRDNGDVGVRRKSSLTRTLPVIVILVAVGGGALFIYNTLGATSASLIDWLLVVTRTTPSKAPPAVIIADPPPSKPFQERIEGSGDTALAVPREEQPVRLPSPPRNTTIATSPPAPADAPPVSANEPRRVRTIPVRPGVGDDAAAGQSARPSGSSLAIAPPAVPPAGGSYVVQVSAQRTEAEAQSSYRALQQKYPTVLGGREVVMRRVDLGDRGGIYYRAQIGPFATSEQANAFCNSLKEAGGQCIVQRN